MKRNNVTTLKGCTWYRMCVFGGITSASHITQSSNVGQEVSQRMKQTMNTWFKFKPFSKAAVAPLGGS